MTAPTSAWKAACLATLFIATPARGQTDVSDAFGHVLGDAHAPLVVVEFADFACSACGEFWRNTWPRVRTQLVETGRVSWRHVPILLGFPGGKEAARAAECAAEQGRFWPMHDRLFEKQAEWARRRHRGEAFRTYAADLELDTLDFRRCTEKRAVDARVRAATETARRAGVRGTPTFLIGGRYVVGALPYPAFLDLVEAAEVETGTQASPRSLDEPRPAG